MISTANPQALLTLFVGRPWLRFKEIGSTNSYLKDLAEREIAMEGTAVSASFQTSGRGQRGTVWESREGQNILLSVLFKPHFLFVKDQFLLSQTFALAVRQLVAEALPQERVFIKWPNDIYVGNKKIAGILIENHLSGSRINSCVFGVGINVNQLDLLPTATSLASAAGRTFELNSLFIGLFELLEAKYLQLRSGQWAQIRKEYEAQLLALNESRTYSEASGDVFTGIIRGVTQEGLLVLERDRELFRYDLKEIRLC